MRPRRRTPPQQGPSLFDDLEEQEASAAASTTPGPRGPATPPAAASATPKRQRPRQRTLSTLKSGAGRQDTLFGDAELLGSSNASFQPVRSQGAAPLPDAPAQPVRQADPSGGVLQRPRPADRDPGRADRAEPDRPPGLDGQLRQQPRGPADGQDASRGAGTEGDAAALGGGRPGCHLDRYRPRDQDDLAPSGSKAKIRANFAAIEVLVSLRDQQRPATAAEQQTLARWSGWGAVPEIFDPDHHELDADRARLTALLSKDEYAAARRTTLNAHYTDAALVQEIWTGLAGLGFGGGHVLEPGCGSGNFIAFAPPAATITGIELDPATAAIAAALYPDAQVVAGSFADLKAPEGAFDAAVGNVPFGDITLHDPRHNPARHSIHNHFIIKSLHLTRPGGLVAMLTSRWTMDARNPAARREMNELADLVGAVRLPTGAHKRAAGTDVVTDLLIFRRREPGAAPAEGQAWEKSRATDLPGGQADVNEYFLAQPGRVLGTMTATGGAYNATNLEVQPGSQPVPAALAAALAAIGQDARARQLTTTARQAAEIGTAVAPPRLTIGPVGAQRMEGFIRVLRSGGFTVIAGGQEQPFLPPRSQGGELGQLLHLRDTAMALLDAESQTLDDTPQISHLREELNRRYDEYTRRYGALNRYKLHGTGRTDPRTGEPQTSRHRPPMGGFRSDPFAPLVFALEDFNEETQAGHKADIFTRRVVAPRPARLGADTPDDALSICLDTHAEVRLPEIARLLGLDDEQDARAALGTLVYDDPQTGRVVPAAEYLSGNVRVKLDAAIDATADDARFKPNVSALQQIIPADLGPAEISVQMGADWVGSDTVQDFLRDILADPELRVDHPGGMWIVWGNKWSPAATAEWGTDRRSAIDIAEAVLTGREIKVADELEDGTRVFNPVATEAAREKATKMADRFTTWIWEDPARAERHVRSYNDLHNSCVPRNYDGTHLSLPGLSAAITLRPWQVAAVARGILEPSVGLYHEVGAGKTLEMICICMERRRLGLSAKPVVNVPNHMLGQFTREWLQAYPQARILAASSEDLKRDSKRDRRTEFAARCATGDWDAVIMTGSAFEMLPVRDEVKEHYQNEQLRELEEILSAAKHAADQAADGHTAGGDQFDRRTIEFIEKRISRTVKQREKKLANAAERLRAQADRIKQDAGVYFEQTGIDLVVVDEAQRYKNARLFSLLPGMAIEGSDRAADLDMKLQWLAERHGQPRAVLATATPWTNSIGEIYTFLRYLGHDLPHFDDWARTFGVMKTFYEMTPGGDFKAKTRLRSLINLPELAILVRERADIKTEEDVGTVLNLPAIAGGAPQVIAVPACHELRGYTRTLADRWENLPSGPPQKGDDNRLAILNDGIKAALDVRLVGLSTTEPQKVDALADDMFETWLATRDNVYLRPDGTEDPARGGFVFVFCDLSTPSAEWNFYDELRDQLVRRGMPRQLVRFIHEPRSEEDRTALLAACRKGQVFALIGSSEKMGTGVNAQDRCVGGYHVTPAWRADIPHQEIGRYRRQGNQNSEVFIRRFVSDPSLDAKKWEIVRQKWDAIRPLMTGRIAGRTSEIQDDDSLSYSELLAASSGDRRLVRRAALEADVAKLERQSIGWEREQSALRFTIHQARQKADRCINLADRLDAAITARRDTSGGRFSMTLGPARYTKRPEAAAALRRTITEHIAQTGKYHETTAELGTLAGFTLTGRFLPAVDHSVVLALAGTDVEVKLDHRSLPGESGIVTRLENRLDGMAERRAEALQGAEAARKTRADAEALLGRPFDHDHELQQARGELAALNKEIADQADANAVTEHAGAVHASVRSAIAAKGIAGAGFAPEAALAALAPFTDPIIAALAEDEALIGTVLNGDSQNLRIAVRKMLDKAVTIPPAGHPDWHSAAGREPQSPETIGALALYRAYYDGPPEVADQLTEGAIAGITAAAEAARQRPVAAAESIREGEDDLTDNEAFWRSEAQRLAQLPADQIPQAVAALAETDVGEIRDILGFNYPEYGIDFGPNAGAAYQSCTDRMYGGHDTAGPAAATTTPATEPPAGRETPQPAQSPGTGPSEHDTSLRSQIGQILAAAAADPQLSADCHNQTNTDAGVTRSVRDWLDTAIAAGLANPAAADTGPAAAALATAYFDDPGFADRLTAEAAARIRSTPDPITSTAAGHTPTAAQGSPNDRTATAGTPGAGEPDPRRSAALRTAQPYLTSGEAVRDFRRVHDLYREARDNPSSPLLHRPARDRADVRALNMAIDAVGTIHLTPDRTMQTAPDDAAARFTAWAQAAETLAANLAQEDHSRDFLSQLGRFAAAARGAADRMQVTAATPRHGEVFLDPASQPAAEPGTPQHDSTRQQPRSTTRQPPAEASTGSAAPPAAPDDRSPSREPDSEPTEGPVIVHNSRGTIVRNTSRADTQVHAMLRKQGFRWSSSADGWYLNRTWSLSTRRYRVERLTASLDTASRPYHLDTSEPADNSGPTRDAEPEHAADPYQTAAGYHTDYEHMKTLYWEVRDTTSGHRLMGYASRDKRPDVRALEAAYAALTADPLDGNPVECAARHTACAEAAARLHAHLTEDRYRAPQFMERLSKFHDQVRQLAARVTATAQDSAEWNRLFGSPAAAPPPAAHHIGPATTSPGLPAPGPAAAAGTGVSAAHHRQAGQPGQALRIWPPPGSRSPAQGRRGPEIGR